MEARILTTLLLVAAIALLVVALIRDGDNMWIALAGVACAFGAAALSAASRKRGETR